MGSCFQPLTAFPCGELDFTFLLDFSGSIVAALALSLGSHQWGPLRAHLVPPLSHKGASDTDTHGVTQGMVGLATFWVGASLGLSLNPPQIWDPCPQGAPPALSIPWALALATLLLFSQKTTPPPRWFQLASLRFGLKLIKSQRTLGKAEWHLCNACPRGDTSRATLPGTGIGGQREEPPGQCHPGQWAQPGVGQSPWAQGGPALLGDPLAAP